MTVDLQLLRNGSMNAEQVALLGEAWRGLDGLDTSMKTDDDAVDDDVSSHGCVFDVANFGARGDNLTDSSGPVATAIAAAMASPSCSAGRTVLFAAAAAAVGPADEAKAPAVFLSRPIALASAVNIEMRIESGVTLAPYLTGGSIWDWPSHEPKACGVCFTTFIDIRDCTNVSLGGGGGLIDGRGGLWWPQRWHNTSFNSLRHPPYMLEVHNTTGFSLENLTVIDPPAQFLSIGHSSRIRMSYFNFTASWVNGSCPHPVRERGHANTGLCEPQNSDGIDIAAGTHDVHVHDGHIQVRRTMICMHVCMCVGR